MTRSPPPAESAKPSKRKGHRSVNNLTPAQLQRKRANDREAQRAIRQRTKEHIDKLEKEVAELRGGGVPGSMVGEIQELRRENQQLRHELEVYHKSSMLQGRAFHHNVFEDRLHHTAGNPAVSNSRGPSFGHGATGDFNAAGGFGHQIQLPTPEPTYDHPWPMAPPVTAVSIPTSAVSSPSSSVAGGDDFAPQPQAYIPTSVPTNVPANMLDAGNTGPAMRGTPTLQGLAAPKVEFGEGVDSDRGYPSHQAGNMDPSAPYWQCYTAPYYPNSPGM